MPERSRLLPRMNAVVARAERGLAAVGAVRADGADVRHLPGPRLVAINAAGERADRADVDAGAALVALQVIAVIGRDFRNRAALDHAERVDAHAFVADAHAAVAQDAARRIEKHHRRILFFGRVDLGFGVAALAGAVAEHHVLQFALAALVAHRAIQRMVGEQEFEHVLARRAPPAAFRCAPPCPRPPAACRPSSAWASSPLPPGTCGRRLAAIGLRNSRTQGSRCRPVWRRR